MSISCDAGTLLSVMSAALLVSHLSAAKSLVQCRATHEAWSCEPLVSDKSGTLPVLAVLAAIPGAEVDAIPIPKRTPLVELLAAGWPVALERFAAPRGGVLVVRSAPQAVRVLRLVAVCADNLAGWDHNGAKAGRGRGKGRGKVHVQGCKR